MSYTQPWNSNKMEAPPPTADSVLEQLGRILGSELFQGASRSRAMLKFVVEQAVNQQTDRLKEYTIGAEALGRGDSFDTRTDPIVRAEASRLRSRLERYYASEGQADPVLIVLPKGSYAPQFIVRAAAGERVPESSSDENSKPRPYPWKIIAGAALLSAAAAFSMGMLVSRLPPRVPDLPLVQFDAELRTRGSLGGEVGSSVVLSPDGTRVAFVSIGSDGVSRLNTRPLDQSKAVELAGTEGSRGPFFSPDGRWVGFWAGGKLKKTPVEAGSPVVLCDAFDELGASWGEDGNIVFAQGRALWHVPDAGGTAVVLLDLTKESGSPAWPQVLPGAKLVLFTASPPSGPTHANIEVLSVLNGKRTVLARGGTFGRYLPNGRLLYINQGTLFASLFNPGRLEVRGSPVPVLDGVAYSPTFGYADLDVSRTGVLVYRKNNGGQVTAQWLHGSAPPEALDIKPGTYLWPRISPDGTRLLVTDTESGETGILIYELREHRTTRLATGGLSLAVWSPDGRSLIVGGATALTWMPADGSRSPQTLLRSLAAPWSFSPDGSRLAYHQLNPSNGFDLWTVPMHTTAEGPVVGQPEPFLATPAYETYPAFSPDGRWIAYGSNESGSWEVYVRAFPAGDHKVQVSTAGGRISRWAPDGHQLFYRTDDQRIMLATYSVSDGRFTVDAVRQWSQTRLADTGVMSNFDLSPDGRRILALVPAMRSEDQQTENHVTFMLNFFSELNRRAPAP